MAAVSGEIRYPFVPKSNRFLAAGQYWALPLSNGQFGCGRVMDVPAFGESDRVGAVLELAELAKALLEIAESATPTTNFATASRCQRARQVLETAASRR